MKARKCIEEGRYYDTTHAALRKSQRRIGLTDVLYVIRYGHHEKAKDQYHEEYGDWTYSIRGQTIDERDIRIAVAFDESDMLGSVPQRFFCRFSGSFEPLFMPGTGGLYQLAYTTPRFLA